jgi:vacuolar iron transporter family protein
VSGFFAAFSHPGLVVMAGFTVAVAGCISMGAGAYVAAGSEREVERIGAGKARFLGRTPPESHGSGPLTTALLVGISYFLGAMVPVLPVLLGGHMAMSLAAAAALLVLVSAILAFLSGMDVRKRVLTNLLILSAAVGVSYAIGTLVRSLWGVNI